MAEQGETTFVFKANTKPAEDSLDSFANSIGGTVTALNQGLELLNKTVSGTAALINKAFDLAKAGEEIKAIGTRFEVLSKQVGLVPEELEKGISRAVKGTVDMEDAMKSASQAIVSLDKNASRIPQLFEMAKKASQLFGGDVIERFDQLNFAVSNFTTRQLRHIGLQIDANKVIAEYARHVGTTAEGLSVAQKQQAILNEVLKQGDKEYRNINESITPLSESMKKLKVSTGEVYDSIALIVNAKLSPMFKKLSDDWTKDASALADNLKAVFLGTEREASTVLQNLKRQLEDLQRIPLNDPALAPLREGIPLLKEKILIQESLINQQATIDAQKSNSVAMYDAEAEANSRANYEKERELNLLRQAQGEYESMMSISGAFIGVADGFSKGLATIGIRAQEVGKAMSTTFKQGLTNSFSAMGQALVKGQNVMDAFASSMLGVLGDLALQLSAFFMAQGIALLFSIGGQAQGVALIAAAAGLAVLGGALKALSGGGGGVGSSPTTPSYTSSVGSYGEQSTTSQTPEEQRATPQTGIQVVVQGNIFDSRETGLQIAQIINDSFDLNGTMIRANA